MARQRRAAFRFVAGVGVSPALRTRPSSHVRTRHRFLHAHTLESHLNAEHRNRRTQAPAATRKLGFIDARCLHGEQGGRRWEAQPEFPTTTQSAFGDRARRSGAEHLSDVLAGFRLQRASADAAGVLWCLVGVMGVGGHRLNACLWRDGRWNG